MTNTTLTSSPSTSTTVDAHAEDFLAPGTQVYCDGQYGTAYPYRQVGVRWDRVTYRFVTESIFAGRFRVDLMHRSQLLVVRS